MHVIPGKIVDIVGLMGIFRDFIIELDFLRLKKMWLKALTEANKRTWSYSFFFCQTVVFKA